MNDPPILKSNIKSINSKEEEDMMRVCLVEEGLSHSWATFEEFPSLTHLGCS